MGFLSDDELDALHRAMLVRQRLLGLARELPIAGLAYSVLIEDGAMRRLLDRTNEFNHLLSTRFGQLVRDHYGFDYTEGNVAHRVQLAMTELFGGFPREFYQGYGAQFPLEDGYEKRKPLYNLYHLYHLLNHLNIFGGSYLEQVKATLRLLG